MVDESKAEHIELRMKEEKNKKTTHSDTQNVNFFLSLVLCMHFNNAVEW